MSGIEHIIGYQFQDQKWLREALTHCSHESGSSYERLEILGDSVIQLVVTEYLMERRTDWCEGDLSRARAAIVSEKALSSRAREIHLGEFLILGKGEEQNGGRNKDRILCDAMEALVGGIYLDADLTTAGKFVHELIITTEQPEVIIDAKTELQKLLGSRCYDLKYEIVKTTGKDHEKIFTVAAILAGEIIGTGTAGSKKAAEQLAATEAIDNLKKVRKKV